MEEAWQRTLWVNWIAQMCTSVGFSFVYPFLPLYVQHLGVHNRQAILIWSGALYAGTTITLTVCAPLWGSLSDRHGRKVMVVRAMGSGAILIFLMSLVQNPSELLVLRILQGALSGSIAASQALVAAAVPRERLGFAMGLMQTAIFAGSSIGPLVGGQLDVPQSFATNINQLYILRGVEGLALGGMVAASSTLLSLRTPQEWRGAAIGLSAGANAAGQALGQLSGSVIASLLGIRAVFLCTAGVLALVCATVTVGVREPPNE
jgi:MFS family permease